MRRLLHSALMSAMAAPIWNPFASMARNFLPRPRYRQINKLNRSRRWRPAATYLMARALSPYPTRAVR